MSDDPGASPRQSWERLPWLVRDAVVWSACLLVVAAALYLLARLAVRLAPLAIALAATLFLTALLDPLRTALGRLGFRPVLASLISLLTLIGGLAGAGLLVWTLTASEFGRLSDELDGGLDRTRDFLTGSLPVSGEQLDRWTRQALDAAGRATPDPVAGAQTALQVTGAILLGLVLLFFLLKDGRQMWRWTLDRVAAERRTLWARAGRVGWHTLSSYTRGTVFIAGVDALGIGLALVLLRVPLALPLALITFLGGFVPIVGATVAGIVAVLVALAAKGPTAALLTALAVIAVQQLEGNLLEPLVMKRQVRLHPVVILVAVTTGTLAAGIAGAFVAVPIVAVTYRVIDAVATERRRTADEPRELPPAGQPPPEPA
ncbi:AI-2E family transporter [Melissospora conviva]|uniref:AI-2E family transporter n=1 Tax=Melissospora conviva TaxID=3388432 RepID=UPI003B7DA925